MLMQRFKSTADYATAEIQRLILHGDLKAGQAIDQVELATRLDISRHPVRQAIERLAERGFIELRPHRSAVVAEISTADMDELYRARNELECLALREGWSRLDVDAKKRIAEIEKKLRRINPTRDLDGFMAVNRDFHLAMYEPCRNRHILRAVIALYDLSERYQRVALMTASRARQSGAEHGALLEALERGDLDKLLQLIRRHNEGTQAAVRAHLGGDVAADARTSA
jgi:DNA-binding GntR family transcriptional regulator